MEFGSPWLLLLYIPFAGLAVFAYLRADPAIVVPSAKPFKAALSKRRSTGILQRIPFFLFCLAVALFIFALARPQKGIEELKQHIEGIDIMLAIDVSGSMQAIDVPEEYTRSRQVTDAINSGKLRKRLDIAKEEIRKFVERRPNDRIGLVAFAPLPYVACPPTLDHGILLRHLEKLEPGIIGDSTGIAGPLASAVNRLKSSEAKRKVVVLFTDGKNNVNAKITPRQAAELAKKFNIVIYTVGIGTDRAFIVQDMKMFGSQLVPLNAEFDKKLLEDIAGVSGGRYYAAKDAVGLEKTMNEIDKLEKTSMEQPRFVDYRDLAFPFISLGIVLLFTGFILGNTLLLKIP